MFLLISLIFILINIYSDSFLDSISSMKLRNNREEATFGIPSASTELKNYLRVKPITRVRLFYFWKLTVTLVTNLIQYCKQSVIV